MPGRFIIFVQNIEKQITALKRLFTTITFDLWGMNLLFKIYFTCTKSSSKFRSYACRLISIITGRSNLEYPRFWLSRRKKPYVIYFSHDNPAVTLFKIVYFWPWEPNPSETSFNKHEKTWNRQRNISKTEKKFPSLWGVVLQQHQQQQRNDDFRSENLCQKLPLSTVHHIKWIIPYDWAKIIFLEILKSIFMFEDIIYMI